MKVVKLTKDNIDKVAEEAVNILSQDGIIIYPTDTLYGLGANALSDYVVNKIFKIKQRPKEKALPILVKDIFWAKNLAYIHKREEKVLEACWPGAVTVILPKRPIIPDIITGGSSNIGMRVAKSDFTDKLLHKFGYPITSTSANLSEQEPTFKIREIIEIFENNEYKPDLIIDAGDLKKSLPSTVLDLSLSHPKILRVGPTKPSKLLELLKI